MPKQPEEDGQEFESETKEFVLFRKTVRRAIDGDGNNLIARVAICLVTAVMVVVLAWAIVQVFS